MAHLMRQSDARPWLTSRDEVGQVAIEYALVVGLVSAAIGRHACAGAAAWMDHGANDLYLGCDRGTARDNAMQRTFVDSDDSDASAARRS